MAEARTPGDAPDVAVATYALRPEVRPDDQLLVEALERRGLRVEARPWTDGARPWTRAPLVVIRSTWDYYRDRPAFLRWIARVGRRSQIWNPPEVLRWNTDKSYLGRFARLGVPVVPSVEVLPGDRRGWADRTRGLGDDRIVVKPRVSADGYLSKVLPVGDRRGGNAHLRRVLRHGPALVQRYLPAVEAFGERSLIYLGGRYSHAVRRTPILLPGGRGRFEPSEAPPRPARRLAERVLDVAGARDLLYARVDVVPDPEGAWRLLELEVTEPSLYLDREPRAPERLARAVAARWESARRLRPRRAGA